MTTKQKAIANAKSQLAEAKIEAEKARSKAHWAKQFLSVAKDLPDDHGACVWWSYTYKD